jgi:putative hydrolase
MDQMEEAARSGRLRRVGVHGERLDRMIVALEERRQQQAALAAREPSVDDLLAIDREFRTLASERGEMRCYPGDTGAVMVLQTERGGWKVRATFSATPLAQRLGLTRDWVVLHFDNGREHGQRTVVTETRSQLHGRRVVRGRERECSACWAS